MEYFIFILLYRWTTSLLSMVLIDQDKNTWSPTRENFCNYVVYARSKVFWWKFLIWYQVVKIMELWVPYASVCCSLAEAYGVMYDVLGFSILDLTQILEFYFTMSFLSTLAMWFILNSSASSSELEE